MGTSHTTSGGACRGRGGRSGRGGQKFAKSETFLQGEMLILVLAISKEAA